MSDSLFVCVICRMYLHVYYLGPGFTFDIETAHTERDVSSNGRTLRSDVTTLKRKTLRGLKKSKGEW